MTKESVKRLVLAEKLTAVKLLKNWDDGNNDFSTSIQCQKKDYSSIK